MEGLEGLKKRLIALIKERSFKYSPEPTFKLSSGGVSKFYFNMKPTTYSPEGLYLIGTLVYQKIKESGYTPKGIGGLTLGADPIALAVARVSYDEKDSIEAFVVRKEPKKYGMGLQIEGNIAPGDHVVIIDDVVTTGSSTIKAIEAAEQQGLVIDAVIVLVDRDEQEGRKRISERGYPVFSILTVHDFLP